MAATREFVAVVVFATDVEGWKSSLKDVAMTIGEGKSAEHVVDVQHTHLQVVAGKVHRVEYCRITVGVFRPRDSV